MSFWTDLENSAKAWISNVYNNDIKPLYAKEAAAFKPLVKATEQDILTMGLPIVLAFMTSPLAGAAKMASAVPQLISDLGAAGKAIAAADAQAGLQIIVNQVKDAATAAQASLSAPNNG